MSVSCSDSFEVLNVPALGENDVDFETITNLIKREEKVNGVLRCLNGRNEGKDQLTSM